MHTPLHTGTDHPVPGVESTAADTKSAGRHRLRIPPGHARDILLLILGALLAFAVDEWRDVRQRRERIRVTLASIREEMRANAALVARARDRHLRIVDTLQRLQKAGSLPDREIWAYGIWNPAQVTSTAWIVARETGALADIPAPTVLKLASVYETQESYVSVAKALEVELMNDVRRDGMEVVLRDRFVQYIPMGIDFSGRERRLLARYQSALELPELRQAGRTGPSSEP